MALLGFFVILIASLFFIFLAGIVFFANGMLGNKESFPVFVFGAIGGVLLYFAFKFSPFAITIVAQ